MDWNLLKDFDIRSAKTYDDPLPSMENLGILLASELSATEEEFLVTSVIHKFFRLPFEDKFVLIPLLHMG